MTMEINASAVSAEIESANIEFDAATLAQEETAVNEELNEWVVEMVKAMKAELAETEVALKKLEAEIAANGVTVKRIAMKAAYEADIEEMKRNLENYVVTESAAEADETKTFEIITANGESYHYAANCDLDLAIHSGAIVDERGHILAKLASDEIAEEIVTEIENAFNTGAENYEINAEQIESAATDNLFVVKVMLGDGDTEEYEVPSLHWACNSMRGAREYYKANYEVEIIGDNKKFEIGKVYSARYVEEYELFGSVSDKHFEVIDLIKAKFNRKMVVVKNDCGEISKCNVHYDHFKKQEWITLAEGQLILLADDVFKPVAENPLKEKIVEIVNRAHKSVIDWAGTLKDYAKKDFYILQNDLKRFIELGEIELAAKTFETIKEKYRTLYAA